VQPSKPKKLVDTEIRAILGEWQRRVGKVAPPKQQATARVQETEYRFMKELFPEQVAFVNDDSKRVAALCTRRAGKTTALVYKAIRTCLRFPGALIPYIALSRDHARDLFWAPLKELNARYGFGFTFNETQLAATAPNGCRIILLGASKTDDIERLRGPKYPLVMLDEAASFGTHIETLIISIVGPALRDLGGQMVMTGTPGSICAGFFYEVTSGAKRNWSVHNWSLLNNPHLPDDAKDLELIREEEGLSEEDPRYIREYLGKWVQDNESLVYRYSAERNLFELLPEREEWMHVLGIDLGTIDSTAFSIGAFSLQDLNYYVLQTHAHQKMAVYEIAEYIKKLDETYEFVAKVADTGGLGKMVVQELNQRHALNVQPAEKKSKFDFIEHMNSDFLLGRIKIRSGDELCNEYQRLIWDSDRKGEHPNRPNHRADATLYAWRKSRHWAGKLADERPQLSGAERMDSLAASEEDELTRNDPRKLAWWERL